MNGPADLPLRGVAVARGMVGLALLASASRLAARSGAEVHRRPVAWATRLLAIRHLAEASALVAWPSPGLRRGIAVVDVVHGTSMVLLASRSFALRSIALAAAAEAFGLALTTYPASWQHPLARG